MAQRLGSAGFHFVCHAGHLSWMIWKRSSAVWINGILVGCNPVLLSHAGEASDISLTTEALPVAVWCAFQSCRSHNYPYAYWNRWRNAGRMTDKCCF